MVFVFFQEFFAGHDVVNLGDDCDDLVMVEVGESVDRNPIGENENLLLGVQSEDGTQAGGSNGVKRCLMEDFAKVEVLKRRRTLAIKEEST